MVRDEGEGVRQEGPTGAAGETCTNPTFPANQKIDLRNVDSSSATFLFDKDAVATSAGAAANWNSDNLLWREWTSGVDETGGATLPANAGLDRFCISCHDADGASQIANFRQNTSQTASNPFADGTVTNNYDQTNRGGVVDIASRVDVDARTSAGGTVTPTDRDNGYARHAAAYVRMAQNHPSVVMWIAGFNFFNNAVDADPRHMGRRGWGQSDERWQRLMVAGKEMFDGLRKLDPTRAYYSHARRCRAQAACRW